MKILLRRRLYASNEAPDRVQAMVEYIDALREVLYEFEEMPAEVVQQYHLHHLGRALREPNGDLFPAELARRATHLAQLETALQALASEAHLALFAQLRAALEARAPSDTTPDLLASFSKRFRTLEEDEPLDRLQHHFLAHLSSVEVLPDDAYWEAIDALAMQVPDRESRTRARDHTAAERRQPAATQSLPHAPRRGPISASLLLLFWTLTGILLAWMFWQLRG